MILKSSTYGCVWIAGVPYAKNSIGVDFSGDNVTLFEIHNSNNRLINNQPYSLIKNADTGALFASMAALKDFIEQYFFCCGGSSGGGSGEADLTGTGMIKEFTITEETLLAIPIPAAMSVYDTHHYSGDADGGSWRQPVIDGSNLDLTGYDVAVGDKLILYGEKTA